jgi:hypothetical protein
MDDQASKDRTRCFDRLVFTNTHFRVVQGMPFTLTWGGAKGPVRIELVDAADVRRIFRILIIGSK